MLNWFLVVAILLVAACSAAPPETRPAPPTATAKPRPTETAVPYWLETQMNGVKFGLWRPAGWEADLTHGLVIAEAPGSSSGITSNGLLIYCFVPPVSEFYIGATDANFAWTVLNQVVKMPSHTGNDVTVSEPVGFNWGESPAAYYLLTSGDGIRALVIALVVPNTEKLVVCNLSAEAGQASRIRTESVAMLSGLSINGVVFDAKSLDALPNPLPFPRYAQTSISLDSRRPANSPP